MPGRTSVYRVLPGIARCNFGFDQSALCCLQIPLGGFLFVLLHPKAARVVQSHLILAFGQIQDLLALMTAASVWITEDATSIIRKTARAQIQEVAEEIDHDIRTHEKSRRPQVTQIEPALRAFGFAE